MDNKSRKKTKTLEVIVADVILETPDTSTIVFFTGNDHLDYEPGHFLTIDPHQFHALNRWTAFLEDEKGKKEPPRAYSMASAPDEHQLAITVKEERYITGATVYPPLLSPILAHRTIPGTKMEITGFTGPYTVPKNNLPKNILHICAGSGIVPNWSILKFCLRNHPDMRHTLIYSNKTWEDTIYRNELINLQSTFPGKLDISFTVTRENPPVQKDSDIQRGRITKGMIHSALKSMEESLIYVCGPALSKYDKKSAKEKGEPPAPRFMESVLDILDEMGVNKNQIKKESYG